MFASKTLLPVREEIPFSFVYGRKHSQQLLPRWKFLADELDGVKILTWSDPKTGLKVCADVVEYPYTGAVKWVLKFINTGPEPTPILEDVQALDIKVPQVGDQSVVLHRLKGDSFRVDDWFPIKKHMPRMTSLRFGPDQGRPADGACPFFNLQWEGGGAITAIGWTGQWQAKVIQQCFPWTQTQVGMEHLHLSLLPGESIRSPLIMQLYWEGDDTELSYNLFRQTMLKYVLPRVDGEVVVPPIAHLSTAAYEWNSSTEENVMEHLEAVKDLGFEVFWLDAYHTLGGFPGGVGNWWLPATSCLPVDRFPRGLKCISDAVHEAGMKWLLWFEPERVAPGTHLDVEHPEWLMTADGQKNKLLNLGIPSAREYITSFLIGAVEEHGMDWLRPDCNIDPLPFWRAEDKKDSNRVGIAEIRYVEGLYQMLDDILAAYPHLRIDNSVSGGRRIDLEMCSRSTPLWRTDRVMMPQEVDKDFDQGALQNQMITSALSRYVPFSTTGQMGEQPHWFRSGFNAGIAFCEDCRPEHYPRDVLKAGIEEGKRIRKFYSGNFYVLSEISLDPADWCVMQYHRPEEQDGIILAFRRDKADAVSFDCRPREVDPNVWYELSYSYSYERVDPIDSVPGVWFRDFRLYVLDCPGSVLVEYRVVR